ncbi:MAG TPA: hypothetical protein VN612_07660 [Acidobacteriaceae bacterium]|nr:hypothetical protein [Acidobacteriaceae bacterium]
MQNAKDTFYTTLQARIAALNPGRTIIVRGTVRPGVLVDENELPALSPPVDCFRLRWTKLEVAEASPLPLAAMTCAITYATDGTSGNAAMDRGRLLSAMDAELAAALIQTPRCAPKLNYSAAGVGVAPAVMGTNIFWADPVFGAVTTSDERLERTATVQVFDYQEAGEL